MSKPQAIIRTVDTSEFEVSEENGQITLRFTPIVFNVRSKVLPSMKGNFQEIITRSAFDGAEKADIRALFNHDPNMVMGRYRDGASNNTMTFESDDTCVRAVCVLPNTEWAKGLAESVKRGDVSGCSFRFWANVNDYSWTRDGDMLVGTLVKCRTIDDFSVVTYPAYEQTDNSVTVRSLEEFVSAETPETIEPTPEQIRSQIQLQRLRLASI